MLSIRLGKKRTPISIHIAWAPLLLLLVVMSRFVPSIICPFHMMTGYPCLTCGSGRAMTAFWRGEFLAMISYNPLMVIFGMSLFLFSLWKLTEHILKVHLAVAADRNTGPYLRMLAVLAIALNWLFLVVSNR